MKPDGFSPTSKDDRSEPEMSSADRVWEERMLPFRRRGLSQSERDRLARTIRASRRLRFRGELSACTDGEIIRT